MIEVFPTAALPHKTNLTAFLEGGGFCKILAFLLSVYAFYLFPQHIFIKIIEYNNISLSFKSLGHSNIILIF